MTDLDKAIEAAALAFSGGVLGRMQAEEIIRRHIGPVVDAILAEKAQRIFLLLDGIGALREAVHALMVAIPGEDLVRPEYNGAKAYRRGREALDATRDLTTIPHHDTIVA